jgi:hypothetical protein
MYLFLTFNFITHIFCLTTIKIELVHVFNFKMGINSQMFSQNQSHRFELDAGTLTMLRYAYADHNALTRYNFSEYTH